MPIIVTILVVASIHCSCKKNINASYTDQCKENQQGKCNKFNKDLLPSFLRDNVQIKAGEEETISVTSDVAGGYTIEEITILKGVGTGKSIYNKEFGLKHQNEYKGPLQNFHIVCRPEAMLKAGLYTLSMTIKKEKSTDLHKIKCKITVEPGTQAPNSSSSNLIANNQPIFQSSAEEVSIASESPIDASNDEPRFQSSAEEVSAASGENIDIGIKGNVSEYVIKNLCIKKGKGTGPNDYNENFSLKASDNYNNKPLSSIQKKHPTIKYVTNKPSKHTSNQKYILVIEINNTKTGKKLILRRTIIIKESV